MLTTLNLKESAEFKSKPQNQKNKPLFLNPAEQEKSRSQSLHSQTRDNKNEINNNTLGSLTKKFVQLIKGSPNQTIEIQQASQRLDIQKRRIYDITNVLEGIGYIQKLGKNLMKWVGGQQGSELQMEVSRLQDQSQQLERYTKEVEYQIEILKEQLNTLSNQNPCLNYFTKQDIVLIMKAMKVKSIMLFIGGNGDQLEILSNPEKKTSQWTFQSRSTLSKLFYCRLTHDDFVQIQQNGLFANNKNLLKDEDHEKQNPNYGQQQKPSLPAKDQNLHMHINQQRDLQTKSFYEQQFIDFGLLISSSDEEKEEQGQREGEQMFGPKGQ